MSSESSPHLMGGQLGVRISREPLSSHAAPRVSGPFWKGLATIPAWALLEPPSVPPPAPWRRRDSRYTYTDDRSDARTRDCRTECVWQSCRPIGPACCFYSDSRASNQAVGTRRSHDAVLNSPMLHFHLWDWTGNGQGGSEDYRSFFPYNQWLITFVSYQTF